MTTKNHPASDHQIHEDADITPSTCKAEIDAKRASAADYFAAAALAHRPPV